MCVRHTAWGKVSSGLAVSARSDLHVPTHNLVA